MSAVVSDWLFRVSYSFAKDPGNRSGSSRSQGTGSGTDRSEVGWEGWKGGYCAALGKSKSTFALMACMHWAWRHGLWINVLICFGVVVYSESSFKSTTTKNSVFESQLINIPFFLFLKWKVKDVCIYSMQHNVLKYDYITNRANRTKKVVAHYLTYLFECLPSPILAIFKCSTLFLTPLLYNMCLETIPLSTSSFCHLVNTSLNWVFKSCFLNSLKPGACHSPSVAFLTICQQVCHADRAQLVSTGLATAIDS